MKGVVDVAVRVQADRQLTNLIRRKVCLCWGQHRRANDFNNKV